jgi:hypothetical protein
MSAAESVFGRAANSQARALFFLTCSIRAKILNNSGRDKNRCENKEAGLADKSQ